MQPKFFRNSNCLKRKLIAGRFVLVLLAALAVNLPDGYAGTNHGVYEKALFVKITGTVTDEKDQPLAGVSVQIKNSKTGVSTDEKGQFTLDAPEGSTLVITATGYIKQEISV